MVGVCVGVSVLVGVGVRVGVSVGVSVIVCVGVCVGNDYNDIELLEWARRSFAVGNAIDELRNRHETVATAEENGFAEAMQKVLGL